ncbi:MAG: hypothetical protein H8D56_06450 [Planctomycetes bacterium]|nr:hypothetical protein [Planctomycetota bacterium]MBL7146975.1 hypothetical protein [Phycisphaerae bacterium]
MTEPLRSAAITAASMLLRARPSLRNTSILSASQLPCLCLSLYIVATGSRSSTSEPRLSSRHLYAGRRLASKQVSARLILGKCQVPSFDPI